MVTVSFIISFVFTLVFVVAFSSLVISTLQLMADSEKAFILADISSTFEYFSESKIVKPFLFQQQLIHHAIVPYVTFVVSLFVVVMSAGLSLQEIIPYELLAVLTAGLSLMVFLQFELYKSPVIMLTIVTRSVGMIYVFLSIVNSIYPMSDYLFLFGRNLFSIHIFSIIEVHVNIMTIVQFPVQLFSIIYLIYKNGWQNFFSGLGPGIMFYCWWLLCRNFLSYSSPSYLIKVGTVALMLMSLSPFFPLVFLFSPMFFAFYYGFTQPFFISITFVVTVSVLIVVFATNFKRLKEAKWLHLPLDYIFTIGILLSIPVLLFCSSMYASIHEPSFLETVSVDQYMEYCGPTNWVNNNMVQTQINCVHLQSRVMEGNGTISSIKITRTINDPQSTLNSLPFYIKISLTCLFGQAKPMCGNRKDMLTCVYAGCNFHHNLHYEFEIQLQIDDISKQKTSVSVSLLVSNRYKELVLNMTEGMFIYFNASFIEGMGSNKLILKATSLQLPELQQSSASIANFDAEEVKEYLLANLYFSVKGVILFVGDVLFGYTLAEYPKLKID